MTRAKRAPDPLVDHRVDQAGRPLGPRALQTRQRLLEVTEELLGRSPVREIPVVEIARQAGTSPATFYQYFKDVSEATLCLAEQAAEELPAVVALLEGPWEGLRGLDTARAVVRAFARHWEVHRAVLLLRNLASDQGDRRFYAVRLNSHRALLERLEERVASSLAAGQIAPGLNPKAAAAALVSLLERLGAHQRGLEPFGVSRDEFLEAAARILFQTLSGRAAPED